MDFWHFLRDLLFLLGGAAILGLLFERVKLNAMLGYLAAGTLVGPGAMGFVDDADTIATISELGVALLLFSIGLEFSVRRLLDLGKVALVGGVLQITVTIVVVALIAVGLGLPIPVAIALGAVVAPSSTACVLLLLRERGEMDSQRGRNALGILLLQDAALVPLVLLVSSLRGPASAMDVLLNIGQSLLVAGGFVAVIYLTSRFVLPLLFGMSSEVKSREIFVVLAVVICIAASYCAHLLHLSPSLGAFMAGVLLAECPFSTQIRADIGGVRILFVTLFFTSVGMLVDLPWLWNNLLLAGVATGVMLVLKAVIILVVLKALKVPSGAAFSTGLVLSQAGEFSFVLATMAHEGASPLLGDDLFQLVANATLGSLFITPLLVAKAPQLQRGFERVLCRFTKSGTINVGDEHSSHDLSHHIIVIGHGPAGRRVVKALRDQGELVVIAELNPLTVEAATAEGLHAIVGDATQPEVLEHLHVHTAIAMVVTIPDHKAVTAIVQQARAMAPGLLIYARARLARYIGDMTAAGANIAMDEEDQIGVALGEEIVKRLNMRLSGVTSKPTFSLDAIPKLGTEG